MVPEILQTQKLTSDRKTWNNRENSVVLELPPLGMVAFKYK